MGDYLDIYSKFLIGNFKFFNEAVDRLLDQPKINKELILRVQKRLKVLKLIENVSESLEKYFYGEDYYDLLEHNVFNDFEYFIDYLLRYRKHGIKINISGDIDGNLNKICSKSYESIHNYNCSDNVQININSNEVFLEDYEEIDELYFIINEIADSNINFKIIDVKDNQEYYEDRINDRKFKNYVNTKVTLVKIRDYYDFIKRSNTNEFILNRMSLIDPNPIWKYHLLNVKLENKELPHVIEEYASYIINNFKQYSYLNEGLYKFIGIYSVVNLCEIYLDNNDYEKFEVNYKMLEDIDCDLLELIYLKAKKLVKSEELERKNFLKEVQEELGKNPDKKSVSDNTSKYLYGLIGEIFEKNEDYINAAQNYFCCGNLVQYVNRLAQAVVDLNDRMYVKDKYSSGMILTSKIKINHKFISDDSNNVNVLDVSNKDYTRFFTFELCAKEIIENNVAGEVAELGVFRGEFSKFLNEVFYNRKLYLFDTFESFDKRDMDEELENKFMDSKILEHVSNGLKNTDIDIVMSKIKYKDNVILKKGYFPESIGSLEEKFCFVSLDVDLYKPTLEGLKYFYPRLSQGGYIFIHDYNHELCPGVHAAVKDFEKMINHKINKCPISDFGGTLIITK